LGKAKQKGTKGGLIHYNGDPSWCAVITNLPPDSLLDGDNNDLVFGLGFLGCCSGICMPSIPVSRLVPNPVSHAVPSPRQLRR